MDLTRTARDLKRFDERRESVAGEHWIALGVGVALLVMASRRSSWVARSVMTAVGTSLIGRAAAGRDGVRKWLPLR